MDIAVLAPPTPPPLALPPSTPLPASNPTSLLPQKRKLLETESAQSSRGSTPRPFEAADTTHSSLPLPPPADHVAKPPAFVATSDPGFFFTSDVPSSRNYRYIPAVLSPTYDPAADELPYYRTGESSPAGCVRASWEDRSPFIRVSEDGLALAGDEGFRSARLNVPIREGRWFFEVEILKGQDPEATTNGKANSSSHVRLGWGRRESSLNGPVGLDGYSYGIRDRTGEKVTLSRPRPYGKSFNTGDVVGLYISLPPRRTANPDDLEDPARVVPKRAPILYKGQSYFESSEYQQSKEMGMLVENPSVFDDTPKAEERPATVSKSSVQVKNTPASAPGRGKRSKPSHPPPKPAAPVYRSLPTLESSEMTFFVNGEDQGVAFQNVYSYLQLQQPKGKAKAGGQTGRNNTLKDRENHFDDGTLGYYPFISLFGKSQIRINAGPDFTHPPPKDYRVDPSSEATTSDGQPSWRPLCERYDEFLAELRAIDAAEEADLRTAKLAASVEQKVEEEKDKAKKERSEKAIKAAEKRNKEKASTSTPDPEANGTPGPAALESKGVPIIAAPKAKAAKTTAKLPPKARVIAKKPAASKAPPPSLDPTLAGPSNAASSSSALPPAATPQAPVDSKPPSPPTEGQPQYVSRGTVLQTPSGPVMLAPLPGATGQPRPVGREGYYVALPPTSPLVPRGDWDHSPGPSPTYVQHPGIPRIPLYGHGISYGQYSANTPYGHPIYGPPTQPRPQASPAYGHLSNFSSPAASPVTATSPIASTSASASTSTPTPSTSQPPVSPVVAPTKPPRVYTSSAQRRKAALARGQIPVTVSVWPGSQPATPTATAAAPSTSPTSSHYPSSRASLADLASVAALASTEFTQSSSGSSLASTGGHGHGRLSQVVVPGSEPPLEREGGEGSPPLGSASAARDDVPPDEDVEMKD